jgi:ribosomal protein S6--L-glutamate ligase
MILSYHPCVGADRNLLCAGRDPDAGDLAAIKSARAVILPQGCHQSLYEMAQNNCRYVFPNFDTKFAYPGKLGQAKLFQKTNVACPETVLFANVAAFFERHEDPAKQTAFGYPFVLKFDWGGEGHQVYLIKTVAEFRRVLQVAADYEKTGLSGFILQEYIPSHNRSLRVVVIGRTVKSYWRIQKDPEKFGSGLAAGALIDTDEDPERQAAAVNSVRGFCNTTGINLAGFDMLFSSESHRSEPLFIEINYFFGRRGLGGSERFYEILNAEIRRWIDSLDL